MRWAKCEGCEEYDLHGIPADVDTGDRRWGLHLFKRGFGGEVVRLAGEFDQVHAPLAYRAWHLAEPAYLRWKTRHRVAA
jgi:lipid II:glycine glycyltransferase (peptidoglycan interpeptide bridge formation enzyme)